MNKKCMTPGCGDYYLFSASDSPDNKATCIRCGQSEDRDVLSKRERIVDSSEI